jgi:hypothetical protein
MKNGSISDTPAIETVTSHSSIAKSGCYLLLSDLIIPIDHLVVVIAILLIVIFLIISRFLGP